MGSLAYHVPDSCRGAMDKVQKFIAALQVAFLLPTPADIQAAAQNAYNAFVDDLSAQLAIDSSPIAKDKAQAAQILSDISLRLRHLDLTPQASAVRADVTSRATAFMRGVLGS